MELREELEYDYEKGINPSYIAQILIKFHDFEIKNKCKAVQLETWIAEIGGIITVFSNVLFILVGGF